MTDKNFEKDFLATSFVSMAGLYLGEVADKMATFAVVLGEDVKKEGLHVIVESLVVQEELGQQTQVLTVDCAHVPVNLEIRTRRSAPPCFCPEQHL